MTRVIHSFGLNGIEPYLVAVEADVRKGLPGFDIVGLPDAAVKESKERVRSALQNMGYPRIDARIVVNLAPAGARKMGAAYDLPILLALLAAAGYEPLNLENTAFIGEIGLTGEIRKVNGVLPMALSAAALGLKRVVVPLENAAEAAAAAGVEALCAAHAKEAADWASGSGRLRDARSVGGAPSPAGILPDLADVRGQEEARRALEIAAAGGHNLLLIGPPGSGKSMLAGRLPSILPDLTPEESIETTKIYSVAGQLPAGSGLLVQRPFRAPHHSASPGSLIGGGTNPRPGEVSLAHNGVLFLDELPEFPKNTLEALRQPLEDGQVVISRVQQRITWPGRFMLAAAMNPCPCGYYGHPSNRCSCSTAGIRRYLDRISGPLLDRIDLQIEVPSVEYDKLAARNGGESSAAVRERTAKAREVQTTRLAGYGLSCNAALPSALLREFCDPEPAARDLLRAAFERLGLSARGYDRLLRVARTIADLDGAERIAAAHLSQAIQLRSLDRKYWR